MPWLAIPSPIEDLIAVADGAVLIELGWSDARPAGASDPDHPVLRATAEQLDAYFAGRRTGFELPLELRGSPFEREVWAELLKIPYGEMRSYGDVARAVAGDVGASQAVGTANGRNPIPVIVPCHRVVGANGKLVGYGGGLHRKRLLLELEARTRLATDGLFAG